MGKYWSHLRYLPSACLSAMLSPPYLPPPQTCQWDGDLTGALLPDHTPFRKGNMEGAVRRLKCLRGSTSHHLEDGRGFALHFVSNSQILDPPCCIDCLQGRQRTTQSDTCSDGA